MSENSPPSTGQQAQSAPPTPSGVGANDAGLSILTGQAGIFPLAVAIRRMLIRRLLKAISFLSRQMTRSMYFWHVGRELRVIRRKHSDFLNCPPPPGYSRGIDFYSVQEFSAALEAGAHQFRVKHGVWPSLLQPRTYSEKIFWQKYFGLLPVPLAGNKLLTNKFIPPSLAGEIKTAETYFRSAAATLPGNDDLRPGKYMLKANHGAGMYLPIRYPLTQADRLHAEAKARAWLANRFGFEHGEWWYSAFEKEIMIEQFLGKEEPVVDWRFHIMEGQLEFISVSRVRNGAIYEGTLLGSDFKPLVEQSKKTRARLDVRLPARIHDAKRIAVEIGKMYPYVRVDILIEDDEIYLGEMTFAPSNALLSYSRNFDRFLGSRIASLPDFQSEICNRIMSRPAPTQTS